MEDLNDKNPNNWRGIFYVNSKDSRVIVPKINPSMGWTLNFGNPYTYLGLVAIIIAVVVIKMVWSGTM